MDAQLPCPRARRPPIATSLQVTGEGPGPPGRDPLGSHNETTRAWAGTRGSVRRCVSRGRRVRRTTARCCGCRLHDQCWACSPASARPGRTTRSCGQPRPAAWAGTRPGGPVPPPRRGIGVASSAAVVSTPDAMCSTVPPGRSCSRASSSARRCPRRGCSRATTSRRRRSRSARRCGWPGRRPSSPRAYARSRGRTRSRTAAPPCAARTTSRRRARSPRRRACWPRTGEIGFGRESSLTGGVASPISAPPVEACTVRSTPARRAASSTWNVPGDVDVEVGHRVRDGLGRPRRPPRDGRRRRIPASAASSGRHVADVALGQLGVHAGQIRRIAGRVVVEYADRVPAAPADVPASPLRTPLRR